MRRVDFGAYIGGFAILSLLITIPLDLSRFSVVIFVFGMFILYLETLIKIGVFILKNLKKIFNF